MEISYRARVIDMNRRRIGAVLITGIALISGVIVMTGHRWLTHQRPLPTNLVAALLVPGAICLGIGLAATFAAEFLNGREQQASRVDAASLRMDTASRRATQLIHLGRLHGAEAERERLESIHGPLGDTAEVDAPAAGEEGQVRRMDRFQRRRPRPTHPSV